MDGGKSCAMLNTEALCCSLLSLLNTLEEFGVQI